MFQIPNILDNLINGSHKKIKGTVVLMKNNVLDFNDFHASVLDRVHELVGKGVSLQLINVGDSSTGTAAKLGKKAYLENWIGTLGPVTAGDTRFKVTFDVEGEIGVPGAFVIRNNHNSKFFLKTVKLDVPGAGDILFVCNSWVYPASKYKKDRIFFANKTYLPSDTPLALRKYRQQELEQLRGDGTGERKKWDRVYDYAYYNDLCDPDKGSDDYKRPTLGGSSKYPYPRRGRTGRPPTKSDPNRESRVLLIPPSKLYVPRDERFGHLKFSDISADLVKSLVQIVKPLIEPFGADVVKSVVEIVNPLVSIFHKTPNEFDSFQDVLNLYEGGLPLPEGLMKNIGDKIPLPMIKEIFRTDGERFLRLPVPQVIKEDKNAWRTDEEFGREMLAGVNPVTIRRLQEFPPKSNLDPNVYGNHSSTIREEHINHNLDGLTVHQALKDNKLFILDHHDHFMPYLRRINSTENKIYGSRTLLFLKSDGTLKPLVIELSLPHPDGDQYGCTSKVYTPAEHGVESSIWQLAKAYVAVNDSGFHQLISHWLNTHAVIEPFVIATNRQLSVLHPIHKLLFPHFRDTMNINALARQFLINAGGVMEKIVFPAKYAMELSAVFYKSWVFTDQALPTNLLKRGIAVKDASSPHGIRLLIEDYPFAVDGLNIWSAIKTWVSDYCSFYYKNDHMVQQDTELQSWWKELVQVGHGDLMNEPWWPKMQTLDELIESCTIIIWISSALHAAVNFGQYPFAGYLPNRPTVSRRFMPEIGTLEYEELKTNPDLAFLKTITSQKESLIGVLLLEILSRHSSDEVYLGQRDTPGWTSDKEVLEAFERFGKKLTEIEDIIKRMNSEGKLKNRVGPVKMPYTLLYPTGEPGLSGNGIPNSISI